MADPDFMIFCIFYIVSGNFFEPEILYRRFFIYIFVIIYFVRLVNFEAQFRSNRDNRKLKLLVKSLIFQGISCVIWESGTAWNGNY